MKEVIVISQITIHPTLGSFEGEVEVRSYRLIIKHIQNTPMAIEVNEKKLPSHFWKIRDNELYIEIKNIDVSKNIDIQL